MVAEGLDATSRVALVLVADPAVVVVEGLEATSLVPLDVLVVTEGLEVVGRASLVVVAKEVVAGRVVVAGLDEVETVEVSEGRWLVLPVHVVRPGL